MVKGITASGPAVSDLSQIVVCGQTFTTSVAGPATVTGTAAYVSNIGAGGAAGGTDVSLIGPTTTVSSGVETWTAILVRDPAGGGAGGVSTVTANQGLSGTQAWPVQFLVPQLVSANVTANVPQVVSVTAATLPVISVSQTGAWVANVNVTANVSQSVNVTNAVSIAAAQSISVVLTGTQAVSIPTSAQPIAVQPRVTGLPSTVTFSMTQSGSSALVASTNGSRIIVKAYGVFNGDTTLHDFHILASNTIVVPAFLAANAGGHNIGFPDPLPLVSNAAMNISVVGAVGTRAVVGYVEWAMVPN